MSALRQSALFAICVAVSLLAAAFGGGPTQNAWLPLVAASVVFGLIATWRAFRTTAWLAVILIPAAMVVTLAGLVYLAAGFSM